MDDCKSSGPTAVISGALVNWVKQLRPFGKLRLEVVRRCDDVKGFKVLPRRWVVERTFGWLFKSRRLCRDYEVRLDHSAVAVDAVPWRLEVDVPLVKA